MPKYVKTLPILYILPWVVAGLHTSNTPNMFTRHVQSEHVDRPQAGIVVNRANLADWTPRAVLAIERPTQSVDEWISCGQPFSWGTDLEVHRSSPKLMESDPVQLGSPC